MLFAGFSATAVRAYASLRITQNKEMNRAQQRERATSSASGFIGLFVAATLKLHRFGVRSKAVLVDS
jgi:hypothetical protein